MIKQLTITKQDVIDYSTNVQLLDHISLYRQTPTFNPDYIRKVRVADLPEKLSVRLLRQAFNPTSKLGVYEILREALNSEYASLILPKSIVVEEEVADIFDVLKPVLDLEMPGRYYITRYGNAGELYLYYPKIIITNTIGDIHEINDLVVQLRTDDGQTISGILGKRYSYDTNELKLGYNHSHLQKTLFAWNGFCLGRGTQLESFILRTVFLSPTADNFSLFLTQFDQYLAWESIEGQPYKSISDLNLTGEATQEAASRLLGPFLINEIADIMLMNLTPEMLSLRNNIWQIDPFFHSSKLLQLEVDACIVCDINFGILRKYDTISQRYVDAANEWSQGLPELDEFDRELVEAFKIDTRIIQMTVEQTSTTVLRTSSLDAQAIIQRINLLLANGYKINE